MYPSLSLSFITSNLYYTLHPSFTVRQAVINPNYERENALVSNDEFDTGLGSSGGDLLEEGQGDLMEGG